MSSAKAGLPKVSVVLPSESPSALMDSTSVGGRLLLDCVLVPDAMNSRPPAVELARLRGIAPRHIHQTRERLCSRQAIEQCLFIDGTGNSMQVFRISRPC